MPGNGPKKYIVTAIDYATRWPVAQATKEHKGNNIQRFIGKEIIAKFGPPKMLITDGGPELAADATRAYLTKNGIQHTFSSPYHPQSNG